ncbi:transporter substrate-binding domain-containing protein [Rhizobium leguminosarum]|uniref:transporter substrate-binding domain-containing protein n=1 Tax=Rhizobium leguminosarum TaxID=384 RepID=UPI00143F361E
MKINILNLVAGLGATLLASTQVSASTLDDVKQKGFLQCGVSQGVAGFSIPDADGKWIGFDVDICRAVAAAIRGGSVCLNSFGRFAKWISASIMPPPSLVPAR